MIAIGVDFFAQALPCKRHVQCLPERRLIEQFSALQAFVQLTESDPERQELRLEQSRQRLRKPGVVRTPGECLED